MSPGCRGGCWLPVMRLFFSCLFQVAHTIVMQVDGADASISIVISGRRQLQPRCTVGRTDSGRFHNLLALVVAFFGSKLRIGVHHFGVDLKKVFIYL